MAISNWEKNVTAKKGDISLERYQRKNTTKNEYISLEMII